MLFCKGHDLERSRSQAKINGTIRFSDLKNIDLDTKIVILSALVQMLWLKVVFLQNGCERNAFAYILYSNQSKYF